MLTAFSLENYRAFVEKTTVELRPLTLLFGYNNAGKSALIRALALIADSARPGARGVLDLSSEAARECDFDDLRSQLSGRESIRLGLSFQENFDVEVEITQDMRARRLVVSELRISRAPGMEGDATTVLAQWGSSGHGLGPTYEIAVDGSPAGEMGLKFNSLAPEWDMHYGRGDEQSRRSEEAHKLFQRVQQLVRPMGLHFQWLGSLRRYPPRYGRYQGEPPARMLPDGTGAAEILAYDKLGDGRLLAEVSDWYERCFKRRIDVEQSSDKRFSVTLEPVGNAIKQRINLADTGEGMAQVLPILVAAAMARRKGPWDPWTLALEQPELHLHPEVHAPLAQHLCRIAAENGAPRMLIETHSENFLLGVQIQIAKRALPADRALVYWVKQQDDGTSYAHRIEFGEDGTLRGFPDKVFNEDLELAEELLGIREQAAQ